MKFALLTKCALFIVILMNYSVLKVFVSADIPDRACDIHYQSGDVIIGGIVPIFFADAGLSDLDIHLVAHYISIVEAITYAIRLVNQRNDILPNVTLGYDIRNNFVREDVTAWSILSMLGSSANQEYARICSASRQESGKQVLGIIGPSYSSNSLIAETIASTYAVPVISYYATSDELSDADRFPFFLRTVPADRFQVKAIVDILLRFNWKYIALFYSINTYGVHGAGQLQKMAESLDICIAMNVPVSNSPSELERKDIADRLIENEKVTIIVIFSQTFSAWGVQRAILEHNIQRKITVIASDGWATWGDFEGVDKLKHGSLFVRHYSHKIEAFHDYYKDLPNNSHLTSKWYRDMIQFISEENKCSDWKSCPIPQSSPESPGKEVDVTNAVLALAVGLDNSIQHACAGGTLCQEAMEENIFLEHLLNVSFEGPVGDFAFEENGDTSGKYSIKIVQRIAGELEWVDIGVWDPDHDDRLRIDDDYIIDWGTESGDVPVSLCIETCGANEIPIPIKKKCCMGCFTCPDHAKVVNASRCEECSIFEWPNDNFTECVPIYPDYVSLKNPVIIAIITVSLVGIVLSMMTMISLWIYRHHQLIKASSRELSSVNLIGVTLSCIACLLTIIRPSIASCSISETCISLGFSLIFAPILFKVNRIWRIFVVSSKCVQGIRFASPKAQLVMTSVSILVQVAIIGWSQLNDPSQPAILVPLQHQPILSLYCQLGTGFIASCSYNMMLVIVCCYYAFRARKVPSNFNESKFIAFSVYSTLVVCLAAIPVYSTAMEVTQMIAALNVALLLNSCLTLLCIYLPKLYAINFGGDLKIVTWSWKSENESNMSRSRATDVTSAI